MDYLPIFLDLKQQTCLVVGGGSVATRKTKLLLKAQAKVTIVSPELTDALNVLVQQGEVSWTQSLFTPAHISNQRLIIAATDDEKVNQSVHEVAQKKNILTNLTDNPDDSDFIFASVLDRSPIIVAVSSGGESPVLARNLRARLETLIPPGYSKLGELMGKYRYAVKQKFGELRQRRQFWDNVLSGSVADHVLAGREALAEQVLQQQLADEAETIDTGEVFLVGAGPGDPELLTFKALRLMQQADIVFYDRLVSKEILALVRKEAELVYVGKQRSWHAVRQEEINNLLLKHAQQGKRVLRLKGGDPFIFGRGGEEIDTLAEHNIPFQVVPGITAASGCASYAGIPLTHRDYAQSCIFVTGQLKEGELNLNWPVLVKPRQTVVVYMGLAGLPQLSQQLQQHGMPADMPAALVQQGTTENQKVWLSNIAELPMLAEREKPIAPTLLIIGEVTKLHDKLSWFKSG
ncbi:MULTISPECIES: siroheme synthase CysG [unclassified Methylophaga]|jgi:uroporphyrin-III C-methyltransferase/precorrin-2 dehydrogenase/sirohydrochlorin ferrochelatase|uniref:siroheme synthase CysG n=5 Tax=Methylophaga TaxID=40222 RepID=UPI00259D2EB1|nr:MULTISPECIES: siroheme synthase CysG [unclassified Methylophaga]|tara:strand:- start:7828 stop:9213 length:1386 start_codon:yes stop_codon:yes gene_type:complete